MSTTVLIATLLAPVFGLVTLSLFLYPSWFEKIMKEYSKSNVVAYVLAIIQVVYGTVIIYYHNVWVADWSVVVTLLGWMALIKGAVAFLAPSWMMSTAGSMKISGSTAVLYGILCGVLTLILLKIAYMG